MNAIPSSTMLPSSKFDRQILLWGEPGQICIENSSVCIIGTDLLACEIAKGLLLANCLSIVFVSTALESHSSTNQDICRENHFYSSHQNDSFLETLRSLNNDASVIIHADSIEDLLMSNFHFFLKFSLVIACNQWKQRSELDKLAEHIRILQCFSVGFYGLIFNDLFSYDKSFLVQDAKNDENKTEFFRNCQFHAFFEYSKNILTKNGIEDNFNVPESVIFDIPYPVLVCGVIALYGIDLAKSKLENVYEKYPLENVQEAIKKYRQFINFSSNLIPSNLKIVFDNLSCFIRNDNESCQLNCSKTAKSLNVQCHLLSVAKLFTKTYKRLPAIPSLLPDVESNTKNYQEMLTVFEEQSLEDIEYFTLHLPNLSKNSIEDFLKRLPFIYYVTNANSSREFNSTSDARVVLFLATEIFYKKYKRLPGTLPNLNDVDIVHFKMILNSLNLSLDSSSDDLINDWICFGNVQFPTVTTALGGIVCQEAIKIISKIFIPNSSPIIMLDMANGIEIQSYDV